MYERGIYQRLKQIKKGSGNVFREFESPRKMYGSSLFKLNYINNGTMESFSSYKALSKV